MKCSLGISNFLEEITSLSHSIVFLYFFALITEEDPLGIPNPFARSPGLEFWCGAQDLRTGVRTSLVVIFSGLEQLM